MRKVITILLALAAFAFAAAAAPAGTIELRGVYSPSAVGPDCTRAAGTRTDGVGPGGYGCKTERGEVECTAKGRCTAICEICGPRYHRTGIYGICMRAIRLGNRSGSNSPIEALKNAAPVHCTCCTEGCCQVPSSTSGLGR